jgi:hypothetical protein
MDGKARRSLRPPGADLTMDSLGNIYAVIRYVFVLNYRIAPSKNKFWHDAHKIFILSD